MSIALERLEPVSKQGIKSAIAAGIVKVERNPGDYGLAESS